MMTRPPLSECSCSGIDVWSRQRGLSRMLLRRLPYQARSRYCLRIATMRSLDLSRAGACLPESARCTFKQKAAETHELRRTARPPSLPRHEVRTAQRFRHSRGASASPVAALRMWLHVLAATPGSSVAASRRSCNFCRDPWSARPHSRRASTCAALAIGPRCDRRDRSARQKLSAAGVARAARPAVRAGYRIAVCSAHKALRSMRTSSEQALHVSETVRAA